MSEAGLSWGAQALFEALSPLLPGLGVEVVSSIASTNSALLERSRALPRAEERSSFGGAHRGVLFGRRSIDAQPYLLIAENQTAGRGRLGRGWRSAAGASLTFTLALPLACEAWSGLSLAVGVALAAALDPRARGSENRPRIGLKWPNDLWLIDPDAPNGVGRKLGGILIETVASAPTRRALIGVGINILPLPDGESLELGSGFAALQEIWPEVDAPRALARIARPLVEAVKLFEQEGLAPFAQGFAARDILAGRSITVTSGEAVAGVARGVAEDGALMVDAAHGSLQIHGGEVSVRLQQRVVSAVLS